MKNNRLSCFLTTCAFLVLVGCGGGGGGHTVVRDAPGTTSVYATGLNEPMHMVFDSSGNLYIANNGDDNIAKVSAAKSLSFINSSTPGNWNNPIGVGFDGGTFYASITVGGQKGIWVINTVTGDANQPNTFNFTQSFNYSSFAFASGSEVFVADQSNNSVDWAVSSLSLTSPTGVFYKDPFIYAVSYGNAGVIKKINAATKADAGNLANTYVNPYAIAFDSQGNAYITEFGLNPNGSQSQISKVTSAGGKSVFADATKGLCASVGIAIRDDYVYVSNGTCTSDPTKSNRILKIAI